MKKLIALILVMLLLTLSLTSCFSGKYLRGDTYYNTNWLSCQSIYAKVVADDFIFDKNDVTMDFNYALYNINNLKLEQVKNYYHYIPSEEEKQNGICMFESDFAIYISNSEELVFESKEDGSLIDPKNKVNAKLWKYISFDDAFSTNYGFTNARLKLSYNHCEKITIPAEFFTLENNRVYIHIVTLSHNLEKNTYSQLELDYKKYEIAYILIGNMVVLI